MYVNKIAVPRNYIIQGEKKGGYASKRGRLIHKLLSIILAKVFDFFIGESAALEKIDRIFIRLSHFWGNMVM